MYMRPFLPFPRAPTFVAKVGALGNGRKGRIYIDYYTKDDLDRICELVKDWLKTNFKI